MQVINLISRKINECKRQIDERYFFNGYLLGPDSMKWLIIIITQNEAANFVTKSFDKRLHSAQAISSKFRIKFYSYLKLIKPEETQRQ